MDQSRSRTTLRFQDLNPFRWAVEQEGARGSTVLTRPPKLVRSAGDPGKDSGGPQSEEDETGSGNRNCENPSIYHSKLKKAKSCNRYGFYGLPICFLK
jgi:hypothetical protein